MNQEAGINQDRNPNQQMMHNPMGGGYIQQPGTQPVYYYPQQYPAQPMGPQSQPIGYPSPGQNPYQPGMGVYPNQAMGGVIYQGQPGVFNTQPMPGYNGTDPNVK